MRPKKHETTGSGDLFRARLDQIINMRHELVQLAGKIDWEFIDGEIAPLYSDGGRPGGLATRCSAPVLVLEPGDVGLGHRKPTAMGRCRAAAPPPGDRALRIARSAQARGRSASIAGGVSAVTTFFGHFAFFGQPPKCDVAHTSLAQLRVTLMVGNDKHARKPSSHDQQSPQHGVWPTCGPNCAAYIAHNFPGTLGLFCRTLRLRPHMNSAKP